MSKPRSYFFSDGTLKKKLLSRIVQSLATNKSIYLRKSGLKYKPYLSDDSQSIFGVFGRNFSN